MDVAGVRGLLADTVGEQSAESVLRMMAEVDRRLCQHNATLTSFEYRQLRIDGRARPSNADEGGLVAFWTVSRVVAGPPWYCEETLGVDVPTAEVVRLLRAQPPTPPQAPTDDAAQLAVLADALEEAEPPEKVVPTMVNHVLRRVRGY